MSAQVTGAIRCLAADTVQKANSGHPGAPMGMAPAADVLFTEVLKFDPTAPEWFDRDRFVLSNGHASALIYSMLHLCGYKVSIDDLKAFRQLHSITPGHPERGVTEGVEVTTGPLGQGISNAVGMAMAEAHLAAKFNKSDCSVIGHHTFAFCGDGCLMEGVAMEALSLAGHLGLHKLIIIYDDNKITIDGNTAAAFTDDTAAKYAACGFNTIRVNDGDTDHAAIRAAIAEAKKSTDKPTMILLRTTIGYGAKLQGTAKVHGSPLGDEDIANVKTAAGRDPTKKFFVEDEVSAVFRAAAARGAEAKAAWTAALATYAEKYPEEHKELTAAIEGRVPDFRDKLPLNTKSIATRKASENALSVLLKNVPQLMGGSADLTGSNLTHPSDVPLVDFQKATPEGRYIRFGVREHGMSGAMNGIHAHGGIIPFGGTFLNFISYALGSVRLAAMSHHQVIYVATHDSIGLGEDGPTHQPTELLASLRAMPNLLLFRPSDQTETSGAWALAIEHTKSPSCLCLSRQATVPQPGSSMDGVAKGGYAITTVEKPQLVLVGTGSEVNIAVEAAKALSGELRVQVVSMPCMALFDAQSDEYKQTVLPDGVPTLSIEAFSPYGWSKYSHHHLGLESWGASAPAEALYEHFGLTASNMAAKGRKLVAALEGCCPRLRAAANI